jgi:uncharacterized delta-60 repeat protein
MPGPGTVRARLAAAVNWVISRLNENSPPALDFGVETLERRVMLSAVEIAGPSVGFVGKSLTFNADLSQDASSSSPSYQWNLLNQYGSPYTPPGGGLPSETLSSFVLPGTLPAGSYALTLAVSESGSATQTATFPLEVLSDPQSNLLYGTIPSVQGTSEGFASAMVRQADGKIVVAGFWGDPTYDSLSDDQWSGWWIARFNPDLTLDTSFQNQHGGAASFNPLNAVPGYFASIQRLAINPTNQDIIVVGNGTQGDVYALQVAELVSKETVEPDGTVVSAGSFDPNFNAGQPFDYTPTPTTDSTSYVMSCGEDVSVLANGDLLVGGGSDVVSYTDAYDLTGSDSDFLLLELTPNGALDSDFNGTGVAEQPGVSGLYDDDGATFYPSSRIFSLAVDSEGGIYAGGVGSPQSGSSFAADSEGIVLVRYSSTGVIDTSFGSDGQSYTDSSAFNGGASGGSAFLSSMKLLSGGKILVVGQANSEVPDPFQGDVDAPSSIDAHVILAQYDSSDGTLDSSYGTSGIVNTSIHFDSLLSPNWEGDVHFDPYTFGTGWFSQNLGSFVFESDGDIAASLFTDSGWELVQFAGTSAADSETATLTIPIGSATSDWSFYPDDNPGVLVVTPDGMLAAGTMVSTDQAYGASPVSESGTGDMTFSQPLVVRYLLEAPAAGNLLAEQTSTGAVSLSWNITLPGQTGFDIERSTAISEDGLSLTDPELLDQIGPTQTDYVDATAAAGTQYYYQIVPVYTSSGTQEDGQASNVAAVYTADPTSTSNVFQEAVQVPLNGASVTTATTLQSGHYYLIESSGSVHLDSDVLGDPAYWYSAADPQNSNGNQFSSVASTTTNEAAGDNYGIAVGTSGALAIPDWGTSDADHHGYFYVVEGTGTSLSFALQGVSNFVSTANVASGDAPLEVEIYEMNGTAAPPPPPSQTTAGVVTLQLSVPNIGVGTVLPVLSASSPIEVLAAASDSSAVPWQLYAEPATGGAILLAQSTSSSGTLPSSPADVTTLDPSSFPDEIYTLLLTTNYPPASPGSPPPPPAVEATYQLVMAKPVMQITSPATAPDGITPVVGSSTPVDVLSGNPDGSEAAWSLYLVSTADSTDALLASSEDSVGTLPGFGADVATLDPSLYPNGTYELELKNADGGLMDSRTITIATAVKKGTLQLPVTDAVVNTASGAVMITRTYDSGLVDVPAPEDSTGLRPIAPNVGPGWSFSLLDAQLSTSAEADSVNSASTTPVLRAGDLVYLTVPDGGQHVFEFDPIPVETPTTSAGSQSSIEYQANFIPMDGSGATLTFNFAVLFPYFHQISNDVPQQLYYDPADNEFGYPGAAFTGYGAYYGYYTPVEDQSFIGFNPAAVQYTTSETGFGSGPWGGNYWIGGGTYQLTNKDGTSYTIDAATGAIESVKDQNGNTTTYTYDPADKKVTATNSLGATLFTVLTNSSHEVTSIEVPGQNSISYSYTSGNLTSVENQASQTTSYAYTDSSFPHFLTSITNPQGQTILQAEYDSSGLLDALVNVQGVTMPVSYGEIGNDEVAQTVVDAAGDTTEDFFNEQYGTLIRKIQTQTDGSGDVQDYIVSLANFNYVNNDVGQISALRTSGEEVLQSVQGYNSFEIEGTDTTGQRFVVQPDADSLLSQTTFDTVGDRSAPAYEQVLSSSAEQDNSGTLQTTLYSDYAVVNTATGQAEPLVTTVEIQTPDADQPTGYDSRIQSQTVTAYTNDGQAEYSLNVVGRDFGSGLDEQVGVFSDMGQGNYPTVLYTTLSGLSVSADNTSQTLAWNAAASAYQWADGSVISIALTDDSLHSRGSGLPLAGDEWTLSISDSGWDGGHGLAGELTGLSFDGSPLGLSNLLTAFLAANPFTDQTTHEALGYDPVSLTVPDFLAQGTAYSYTSAGDGNNTLVSQTQSVTAEIGLDGSIESVEPVATTAQNTYYGNWDYTYDSDTNAWIPNPGASYGQVQYSFDAAGQETYYAYNAAGQTVLQYVYKQWTDSDGDRVDGWVGTTSVYDSAGRVTDTYQATYADPTADTTQNIAFQAHILPVISDGSGGIEIDTNASDSSYVTVYAAPIDTQHTDYTALGQVADTIDQYGGETSYTYDASGNKIETLYPNGTEMLSVFDALNRAIWTTNQFYPGGPNSPVLTHTIYNQLGQQTETDIFDGGSITVSSTTEGGSTIYSSSISTSTVDGVLTPTGGTFVSSSKTFYDAAGHEIETIAPSGLRTGTIYAPDGSVLETGPLKASAPDGGSPVTTYEGVASNEFSISNFEVDSSTKYTNTHEDQYDSGLGLFYTRTNDQDGRASFVYTDALGRTVQTDYGDGSFTETLYGVGSDPVAFDEEGDAIPSPTNFQGIPSGGSETVSIAERQDGDPLVLTYDIYDASNNLVAVYQPAVADMNPASSTYYPTYGQLVNPLTRYAYDTAGNEISQTDADGNVTTFGYDQNGNQVRQTLPDGESESWAYNLQNQVTGSIDFDGNTATYAYATSGAEAGLLQSVVYVGATGSGKATQTVSYTYNDLGQQATVTDASGTTTESYDDFGNLSESQTPEGTIWYVFDAATGNHTETYTANTETYYGYDIQGRLTTVTIDELNGTTLTTPVVTTYGYDPVGNKVSETDPNGDLIAYAYDAANRLTSETITDGSTTLFDEQFTLNDNGTRASATETQLQPDGSTVATISNWTYDADGRLIGEIVIDAGTAATPQGLATSFTLPGDYNLDDGSDLSMTWDATANAYLMDGMTADQIGENSGIDTAALLAPSAAVAYGGNGADWVLIVTNESYDYATVSFTEADGSFTTDGVVNNEGFTTTPSFTVPTVAGFDSNSYAYDLANNRMLSVHYGPVGGNDEAIAYSYNGDDELTSQTSSLSGTTTNSYDANGSLTSGSTGGVVTATYTYDVRSKMVGYSDSSTTASYVYDDAGNRVEETVNGTATYYLTDTQNPTGYARPLEQKSSPTASPSVTYFLGDRVIGQAAAGGTVTYLLPDGHGSTEQLANSSGTVTAALQYDAFGGALNFTSSTAGTDILFGGDAVYDPASGTYFHGDGVRQTLSFLFIQRDFGSRNSNNQDPVSLHKYLYADADPITGNDPSGHADLTGLTAAGGAEAAELGEAASVVGDGASAMESVLADAEAEQVGELEAEAGTEADLEGGDAFSRGRSFEDFALRTFNLIKNTGKIFQNGIRAIPDAYEWGKALWEIKDVGELYQSSQILAEMAEAEAEGIQFNLVISEGTTLTGPLLSAIQSIGGAIYELAADGTITPILQGTALGY